MTEDDTFVVTSNAALSPDYVRTFHLADMLRWIGDPFETVVGVSERRPSMAPRLEAAAEAYTTRTELGRRLGEIRKRAMASGEVSVSGDELERIRAFAKCHRERCDCPFPPEPDWE